MSLKGAAKELPYPLRRFISYSYGAIPPSVRFSKIFWRTYNFLQESQFWSKKRLEQYQVQQVNNLLRHAYENVPYYRKIFDKNGLKPKDIHDLTDLRKLPCLNKDALKVNFTDIVARNIKVRHMIKSHTSGTTGKPLQFYIDPSENEKEWAFICHQWSRVGYRPGESRVDLAGSVKSEKNCVVYDPISRVLTLSPCVDSKEVSQYYLKKIKSYGAKFLRGYPSAIASFASMLKRYSIDVPFKLKAIFFASEAVYDWEREIVEDIFTCRVFAHYGSAECVALAAECERSHFYHFIPQYGVTEIDPDTHEIIATGFLNYVNPFIRYRTTDIASLPVLSKCTCCGRNYFPIIKHVEGRLEDYIITPKGTLIPPAVITHPFKDLKTIKDTQLIQESTDQLVLRVVLWDKNVSNASTAELKRLSNHLQDILGVNVRIKIEIVDEIERLKSGKFKWILSDVSKGLIEKGLEGY